MTSQAKRPYPASLAVAASLLVYALCMAFQRWQSSLLAMAVFVVVVGPVYLAECYLAPQGASLLAGQILLMATGYVALIATLTLIIYRESRSTGASRDACQARLTERWPGIRSEVIKTLALGTAMIGLVKFGLYLIEPQGAGVTTQNAPLIFYPVMGTALFAWVSHFHSCVHTPQLQLVARSTMDSWERAALAKLAKRRYDAAVSLMLFVPMIGALGLAFTIPLATPLLWLLTYWYLEVSLYRLWLFTPVKDRT